MKREREGWFFQKDGTIYCPEHVPGWVEPWRARKLLEKLADEENG